MTAAQEPQVPDVPHRLWSVLDVIERISFSMLVQDRIPSGLVQRWIADVATEDIEPVVDCLESVALALDYIDQTLAGLGEPGRTPSPDLALPSSREERRAQMQQLIAQRAEPLGEPPDDAPPTGEGPPPRALEGPATGLVRWAIRHALGLVESAMATAGPATSTTRHAVTSRASVFAGEDTPRVHEALGTIHAAVIFLLSSMAS